MRNSIFVLSIIFLCFSCDNGQTKKLVESPLKLAETHPMVKNVILLIGDGMGLGQISAGMYSQQNHTALERCKVVGIHKPHASNKLVTDSAAAATSFACGVKTYNGAIGVTKDTLDVESIMSLAQKSGKKTGLVASSTIVHATPAAFYAHNKSRKNYEEIAADLVNSNVDFFVGGGKQFFSNRNSDGRDLYAELRAKGYIISDFLESEFATLEISKEKKFGYLTANKDPLPVAQGRDYLIDASKAALNYLENSIEDDGFFLMIEGSQIDWGGHANDGDYVVSEFIEYDKIIDLALDFADTHPNTLVVITADHETGGLAIQPESKMDSLSYAFTSTYHTGTMIPVFAYGQGAEDFGGIYENTAIFDKIKLALDL